jgi:hypothetical protein
MDKMRVAMFVSGGLFLSVFSSCGGGSCGKVQPCGGNVVGSWKASGSCVNSASFSSVLGMGCVGTTGSAHLSVSGTVNYNADMTYAAALTESGTVSITLPPACRMQGAITLTCSQTDQQVKANLAASANAAFETVSCSGSDASCTCRVTVTNLPMSDAGTFSTSGTMLTMTSGTTDYCVTGNELHLISVDTTMPMGPMGQVVIASDVVLTR